MINYPEMQTLCLALCLQHPTEILGVSFFFFCCFQLKLPTLLSHSPILQGEKSAVTTGSGLSRWSQELAWRDSCTHSDITKGFFPKTVQVLIFLSTNFELVYGFFQFSKNEFRKEKRPALFPPHRA